ncbi:hypothetical protein ACFP56_14900 [Paenibacillus septentrionalis]|uniref:Uncharacterized protein n=1 Tax=Paenibacillus septentrionalis TaxID=429342 RepID=A0ABW1V575_9BACL
MENIASFLKTTISILITLAIISAGIFLWNKTIPVLELANNQASIQAMELADQQYSAYDNQLVSGSQLNTAYRRYSNHDVFVLYVQKKNNNGTRTNFGIRPSGSGPCRDFDFSTGKLKTGTLANCYVNEDDLQSYSGTYYVPPQSKFQAVLVRDLNNSVIGIYFKEQ